jgi:hypothetical protein
VCLKNIQLGNRPSRRDPLDRFPREALRSRPRPRILAGGSFGVLECCALSELHPASAGLGVLSGQPFGGNSLHRNMPDLSFDGNCVEIYLRAFNHAKLPEPVHFC